MKHIFIMHLEVYMDLGDVDSLFEDNDDELFLLFYV